MAGEILVSTAYLPPVEYFAIIANADEVLVEREENYLKQTYRSRCYILSAHGPQLLSVPVYLGSFHKTLIKDIRIDYSKRWQQVHCRAITASYMSSPYFQFYFENIERIILKNHVFLLDLNMSLTESLLDILKLQKPISYTADFKQPGDIDTDFRYIISPKIETQFRRIKYPQVFKMEKDCFPGLSIIDLIFNMGPESADLLQE